MAGLLNHALVGNDAEAGPDLRRRVLHPDILSRVFCFTTRNTDVALLRLNRETHHVLHKLVYRHLVLSKQDLSPLFAPQHSTHSSAVGFGKDRLLPHIRTLSLPLHTAQHCGSRSRTPLRPLLPALHTLRLELDAESPLGWSLCKLSDTRGFPYYPITCPCPLLRRLRPKHLVIANVATLHSITPLTGNRDILSNVEEVTIIVDRRYFRPDAHRHGGAPILSLGEGVKKVVIRWQYTGHKMRMGRPQRPKRGCAECLPVDTWDKSVRWQKGDGIERSAEVWTYARKALDSTDDECGMSKVADGEWKLQEGQRRDLEVPAWRFAQAAGAPWYGPYGYAEAQQGT